MEPAPTELLRRTVRDLLGLIALLPFGAGKDARGLLVMLAEAIEAIVPIDAMYAFTDWTAAEVRVEIARVAHVDAADRMSELRDALCAGTSSSIVGSVSMHTATLLLGHDGRRGKVIVASREAEFPTPHELVLMQAAASIVTAGLENAKALEERERANRAKDEFLALLGHELRNPLAPITTALDLLNHRSPSPTKELQIIARQVQHMSRLVDDLLDISRVTRGHLELQLEPVPFADVVAEAIETVSPLFQQRRHHVEVDVGEEAIVDGDRRRLVQVLSNILVNAAKFTPPAGRVDIRVRRDGDQVTCTVRDTGSGMAPETLRNVFDAFFQGVTTLDRASGGLGIGLALVKNIVERHRGTVAAHSDGPGTGTTIVVRLPCRSAQVAASRPAPQLARVTNQERVLVVDDNRDAADLLADLLRATGHHVEVSYAPRAALDLLARFDATIAILDIGLPDMSGYELACAIREQTTRPLRLIALTGYGQASDIQQSLAAGFDSHLTKPVSYPALLAALTASTSR